MKIMQICVIFAVTSMNTDKDWHVFLYGDFLDLTGLDGNSGEMSLPAPCSYCGAI